MSRASGGRRSLTATYTGAGALLAIVISASWLLLARTAPDSVTLAVALGLVTVALLASAGAVVARRMKLLASSAMTDSLTGIWNRRQFEIRLREEIARADRQHTPIAILMIDVDHLKELNDGGGHQLGDRALRTVADVIRRACRVNDVPARYAGDEFVVIAPSTTAGAALTMAERIRSSVHDAAAGSLGGLEALTVSIGIVDVDGRADRDHLFAAADRALYIAKQSGRDRVFLADPVPLAGPSVVRVSGQLATERAFNVSHA